MTGGDDLHGPPAWFRRPEVDDTGGVLEWVTGLGVGAGDPLLDQLGREFERVRLAERRAIVAYLRELGGRCIPRSTAALALRDAAARIERGRHGS